MKTVDHNLRVQSRIMKKLRADKIIVSNKLIRKSAGVHLARASHHSTTTEPKDDCPCRASVCRIAFVTLTKSDIKSLTLPDDASEKAITKRNFRYQDMALKAASKASPEGLCGEDILQMLSEQPLSSVQQTLDCRIIHLPEHRLWAVIGDESHIQAAVVTARRMRRRASACAAP